MQRLWKGIHIHNWSQKIAMKVDLGNYIYGKITLNTHFGVADFIGFGMGVRL